MQTSIIFLLAACALMAAQGYYFGFVRPPRVLAWLAQATFIFMTFIMVPMLAGVLYYQNGATARLQQTGFTPHPSIKESIGAGFGSGNNPIWVFDIDADEESVRKFYLSGENTGDWALTSDNGFFMIFEKDGKSMLLGFRKGWGSGSLTFSLTDK